MKDLILPNVNTVTKSRYMVKESYSLSLDEHRLILSALAKVDRTKELPEEIIITAADFVRDWPEINKNLAYKQMKTAGLTLYERTIRLDEPDLRKLTLLRWVQSAVFWEGEGLIKMRFSNDVRRMLGSLKDNFMQLRMNDIRGFKSAHAIRFFELLMLFKSTGVYAISVDDLRKAMGVNDIKSYQRYAQFKQKVLAVSMSEINEKSGWQVDVIEVKKGRSVASLRFHFGKKKQLDLDL